jgi:hypothetical protein
MVSLINGVDSPGSGWGPVAGSFEHGDETSGAMDLVSYEPSAVCLDQGPVIASCTQIDGVSKHQEQTPCVSHSSG